MCFVYVWSWLHWAVVVNVRKGVGAASAGVWRAGATTYHHLAARRDLNVHVTEHVQIAQVVEPRPVDLPQRRALAGERARLVVGVGHKRLPVEAASQHEHNSVGAPRHRLSDQCATSIPCR